MIKQNLDVQNNNYFVFKVEKSTVKYSSCPIWIKTFASLDEINKILEMNNVMYYHSNYKERNFVANLTTNDYQ